MLYYLYMVVFFRQAFVAVENSYWDSVGDKLAERTSVQYEIPDDLTSYEAYQKYPHLVDKLNTLNTELSCGELRFLKCISRSASHPSGTLISFLALHSGRTISIRKV